MHRLRELAIFCRIAGKQVGNAIFTWLCAHYGDKDAVVEGRNNCKNHLLIEMLEDIGFTRTTWPEEETLPLVRPKDRPFAHSGIVAPRAVLQEKNA